MHKIGKIVLSIVTCELVGLISVPFTIASIPTWYAGLNKPPFSPPNWIFGPVWTLLYCMMGISLSLIWMKGFKTAKSKIALRYFVFQLICNFLWSFLFFGLRSPILGLICILFLLFAIIMSIIEFKEISKTASYLLFPYLLWVSFATLLNISIVILN